MQNNDLIGTIAYSKAGRDKGNCYIVIEQLDKEYVLLADGRLKTADRPKKKKIKHLNITNEIAVELRGLIMAKDNSLDSAIRKFLKLKGIVKEV